MNWRAILLDLEAAGATLTPDGRRMVERNPPVIRTRCAWCKTLIHDGALTADGKESHGACEPCGAQMRLDAGLEPDGEHCIRCGRLWQWHGRDERDRVCGECRYAD